ncbi:hypothetical protein TNCV_1117571 [Trichonephila clavipes]|nr:hypothetical protein TNCV_1117571 [Trichonephila clavipes]
MQGEGTRGKRQQRKGKNISEKREMNVKKENLRTFALRCSTWLDAMGYIRGNNTLIVKNQDEFLIVHGKETLIESGFSVCVSVCAGCMWPDSRYLLAADSEG